MAAKWDTIDINVINESAVDFGSSEAHPPLFNNGSLPDQEPASINKHMAWTLLKFQESKPGPSSALFTFERGKLPQRLAIWVQSDPEQFVINASIGVLNNEHTISSDDLAKLARNEAKPGDFGLHALDYWNIKDGGDDHQMLFSINVESDLIQKDNPDYWKSGHPTVLVHIRDLNHPPTANPNENNPDVHYFKILAGFGKSIGQPVHESITIAALIKLGRLNPDVNYDKMLPQDLSTTVTTALSSVLSPARSSVKFSRNIFQGNPFTKIGEFYDDVKSEAEKAARFLIEKTEAEKAARFHLEKAEEARAAQLKADELLRGAGQNVSDQVTKVLKAGDNVIDSAIGNLSGGRTSRPSPFPAEFEFIRGVLWNDDPKCLLFVDSAESNASYNNGAAWYAAFATGQKILSGDKIADNMIIRSHFQDLQSLHAMASKVDEDPKVTLAKIMTWIEVMYRLATGDSLSFNDRLESGPLSQFFNQTQSPSNNNNYRDLLIGDTTNYKYLNLENRAVGVIFHIIQDSYAVEHCKRKLMNPDKLGPSVTKSVKGRPIGSDWSFQPGAYADLGPIQTFHCYSGQNEHEHEHFDEFRDSSKISPDNWDTFNELPGARAALSQCVKAANNVFQRKPWAVARADFEEIFKLDDAKDATPSNNAVD